MQRRILAIATAAIALVTVGIATATSAQAATPAAATAAAQPQASSTSGYQPPPIDWGPCTEANSGDNSDLLQEFGAECGYLIVPMDYKHPNAGTIQIAVSRILHTDPSNYQGVMLVNPGGPGGSGLVYSVTPDVFDLPDNAGADYDWIGFDPRGVGNSIPSLSCDPSFFAPPRPPYNPSTPAIMNQWVSRSKAYANSCTSAEGNALFNHVKTTDSVEDMESLRKALGQSKINFYGFSYGTYLGSVYMTLHPDQVRRFVLDSTVDPRGVWYQDNLDQDVAFQTTFNIYMSWLAQYSSVYDVGNTQDQVRQTFLNTESALNAHPADGVLGGDELLDVFTSAAYYVYGWTDIAQAYSDYLHTGDASELIDMYESANPTGPGGDNSYAMYLGTQCTDAKWPQSQSKLNKDSERVNKTAYFFTWANAWFNGPCPYWKYPASQPVKVKGSKVHVPILMIDETYDPATPYSGSLYVRSIFPTASLIEGVGGTTHAGTLSGVACTDDAIAAYLLTGAVPSRQPGNHSDLQCPPVPQPVPAEDGAIAAATVGPASRAAAAARLRAGIEGSMP